MLGVNTMVMIKEIRKSRGLTAKELGELVGKAESTINLYENGKREPDFETLLKMSEVLNCSTDSLLGKNAALTNEEEHLLWLFRQFSSDRKSAVIKLVSTFLDTEKNNADTSSVSA
jgi:transcriptional regulator with XRE-family HTH domain